MEATRLKWFTLQATIIHWRRPNLKSILKVVLEPSDEGGYTVYVPSLPGCISEGEDVGDALANIQEAIALYLEPSDDELQSKPGIIVKELVI